MTPKLKKRLIHLVAYPAFFMAAFTALFFVNFPYDALKERLVSEARQKDIEIAIDEISPTLLGIEARGLSLHLFKPAEGKSEVEPLRVQSLTVFPHLFPLGVHVRARLMGGHLDAAYHPSASQALKLRAKDLKLSHLPPEATGNVVMDGTLALLADLAFDPQDFAKAEGRLALLGTQLLLLKGNVQGLTLPRVDMGRLELDLDLTGGKARFKTARLTGVDIVATMEGEVRQARKIALSSPNLTLRFQPAEEFLKRNSLVSAALGMAMKKDKDGYYEASIKGTLGKLKLTPNKNPGKATNKRR